jgi:hypothetical protein
MARARGGSLTFRILCSVVSCCSIFFISTANDEQYLGRSRPQYVTPKRGCRQFSFSCRVITSNAKEEKLRFSEIDSAASIKMK